MKLKALLLTLVVAGASATVALAGNGHGNGNGKGEGKEDAHGAKPSVVADSPTASATTASTTSTTEGKAHGKSDEHKPAAVKSACRPNFSINLQGTVAAAPTGTSVAVLVAKGNAHGAALRGKQLTVDASGAKVIKQGRKTVAALAANDRVLVKGKACANADLSKLSLVATQIVVLGAKGKGGDDDDDDETTSSTTTPTSSTTTPSSSTTTTTASSSTSSTTSTTSSSTTTTHA